MAYVNVKDWSVEQVTDWLKGLDNIILAYAQSFLNNGVNGHQLLSLRADDLEHLGVFTLGHQEIILESVEHLRNFHYELDKENLQMLALRLSCAANSLNRELQFADENATMVQTQTMSDVHNIISTIKPLVCWLDRSPFRVDKEYIDTKMLVLQLGIEIATNAHRDIFSEKPVKSITNICEKLTKLADSIIQEMKDPMILQPASLDLSTLKKKEQELGFFILPSNSAIHQIAEIKYGSPAHLSTKIEEGDEIVQVNYQTVVGWQRKKVVALLQESPPEIVLTLKKRPRHTKIYGQIYMKPYRLPSKKRAIPFSRWNENLPSPRLLTIHDLPQISMPRAPEATEIQELDSESSSGSDSEPPDSPLDSERLYLPKPRSVLQRRNTITGATPTNTRPSQAMEQYWKLLKNKATSTHSSSYNLPTETFDDDSMYIRDKSASYSLGLEFAQRPTTVIGIQNRKQGFKTDFTEKTKKIVNFDDKKIIINDEKLTLGITFGDKKSISTTSLSSLNNESIEFIDEAEDLQDRSKMTTEPDVEIEPISVKNVKDFMTEVNKRISNKSPVKDTVLEDVHINNIIKKFDQKANEEFGKPKVFPRTILNKQVPVVPQKPVILPRTVTAQKRGKLDKSFSTPAYDLSNEENGPRNLFEKDEIKKIPQPETNLSSPKLVSDLKAEVVTIPESVIKYELGIPILNDAYVPHTPPPTIEIRKTVRNILDVPPKPPPRTHFPEPLKRKLPETPPTTPLNTTPVESKDIRLLDKYFFEDSSGMNTLEKQNNERKTDFIDNENANSFKSDYDIYAFDPSTVSTPITKQFKEDILKIDTHKNSSLESNKSHKTSPTNIVTRAIYSSKGKSGKKKNSLIAKKRKVSVQDVSPGEIQGYLHQRLRSKHNQDVHWEKRWFVLNGNCLYGFKTNESIKAECFIFLSGFTVTEATEVKSRSNAFKVYHTGTIFYFSAENDECLSSWLEMIAAATLNSDAKTTDQILYSESDDDSESESASKTSTLEKPSEGIRKFNSLKKFTSKKRSENSVSGSTSLDRKWFFNKSPTTPKNVLPVPTAQFRSYRKIPASTTIGNFTSHVSNFSVKEDNFETISTMSIDSIPSIIKEVEYIKPKPLLLNHLHASNPSLCNLEYSAPPFQPLPLKSKENLAGFVTLEELMNRQSEKERKFSVPEEVVPINPNLIRPDVVYGEIPIRPNKDNQEYRNGAKTPHSRTSSDSSEHKKESSCFGKRSGSVKSTTHSYSSKKSDFKSNSSLPRNPKLHDSGFIGGKQKSNSSKSLCKSKERSYEMIYCPQTTTDVHFAQNRTIDGRMYHETPRKCSNSNLKSACQYTPMSLPLTTENARYQINPRFELNLDEKSSNKSGKFKQFFMHRDSKKEKKYLGSPKLQKASFPKSTGSPDSEFGWPSHQLTSSASYMHESLSTSDISEHAVKNSPPAADYPGLEYPPVFEAETYSLANPQSTLFRKHSKKN